MTDHPDTQHIPGVLDPHGHLDPWDRLQHEGEGPSTYGWFLAYRDLGPTRRIKAVSALVNRQPSYLWRISAQFRWVERAQAWDREQARLFREAVAARRVELVEKHAQVGGDLVALGEAMLLKLKTDAWSPWMVLRAIELGVKIQRLAAAMPSTVDPASDELPALPDLSDAERASRMDELARELDARRARLEQQEATAG